MLVTLMTDASWCHKTKLGGYGYWVTCERIRKAGGAPITTTSENSYEAEFKGVIEAIVDCLNKRYIVHGDCIIIQLDCAGVVNALNTGAIKSTFGKQAYAYLQYLKSKYDLLFQAKHVRGHTAGKDNRSISNRHCDLTARINMNIARGTPVAKPKVPYKQPKKKKQFYVHDRSSDFEKEIKLRRRMQASRRNRTRY